MSTEQGKTRSIDARHPGQGSSHVSTNPHAFVLVHSPFLGPASLRPLADELEATGVTTFIPDLRAAVTKEPVHERLVAEFTRFIADLSQPGELILVGHSGAGPLLPALAEMISPTFPALIYLDAELPTPGRALEDVAPVEQVEQLTALIRGSQLLPWHLWFDASMLFGLIPDDALRSSVFDEAPRVAAAIVAETRPTANWNGPAGYLQLSPPYTEPAARAEQSGWPVKRINTHHLAAITQPETVAPMLLDITAELTQ